MAQDIWAQTFKYLADNNVLFEGILLKPSMVTPGADSGKKVSSIKLSSCNTFNTLVSIHCLHAHNVTICVITGSKQQEGNLLIVCSQAKHTKRAFGFLKTAEHQYV